MALHGVAQAVDALDGGVAGGVKADGVVGAAHIVVDGGGDAHHRHAEARQLQRAAEGPVAADGDDAVETQHLAGVDRPEPALLRKEVIAARGEKDRPAAGEDVTHAFTGEGDKVAVDKALPAAANADALNAVGKRRSGDGTHGGVHAGGVAAAGQYADAPEFFHVLFLPVYI